jgi:hypothetical protein
MIARGVQGRGGNREGLQYKICIGLEPTTRQMLTELKTAELRSVTLTHALRLLFLDAASLTFTQAFRVLFRDADSAPTCLLAHLARE